MDQDDPSFRENCLKMEKKIFNLMIFVLFYKICFFIYPIALNNIPIRVYVTEKAGVLVKDSINIIEWYIISNKSEKEKIVCFYHFSLADRIANKTPPPIAEIPVKPYTIIYVIVPNGHIDQIRIDEFNTREREFVPVAYINAAMLRDLGSENM